MRSNEHNLVFVSQFKRSVNQITVPLLEPCEDGRSIDRIVGSGLKSIKHMLCICIQFSLCRLHFLVLSFCSIMNIQCIQRI